MFKMELYKLVLLSMKSDDFLSHLFDKATFHSKLKIELNKGPPTSNCYEKGSFCMYVSSSIIKCQSCGFTFLFG